MDATEKEKIPQLMARIGAAAKAAARALALAPTEAKNKALTEAAQSLRRRKNEILSANAKDMAAGEDKGLSAPMLDRLALTDERLEGMATGLDKIAKLDDPIGTVLEDRERPNGLRIQRVRVPLGVIGVIYESRPNVTADAGSLCLKAGNAVILRGGKSLIERVTAESKVPLFKHLEGICHSYVNADADPDMARKVVFNAKMRRTGICGTTETLLIDRAAVELMLSPIVDDLTEAGCEVRGDAESQAADQRIIPASDEDWNTEYLDSIISVRVVDGVEEAIEHIDKHGSQHTDCIITANKEAADTFVKKVDSAIVLVNASTQFADGGEFGMGAEIGISTGKLHARGPVGVEQLTSSKYIVRGDGQIRP